MKAIYEVKKGQDMRNHVRSLSELDNAMFLQSAQNTANVMHELAEMLLADRANHSDVLGVTILPDAFSMSMPAENAADATAVINNPVGLASWKIAFIKRWGNLELTKVDRYTGYVNAEKNNTLYPTFEVAKTDNPANIKYWQWNLKYKQDKMNWCNANTAE